MSDPTRVGVRLETRSLWRLRASASLTRWVLYVTAAVGVGTTARFAIAPPQPVGPRAAAVVLEDRGAEGFASLFARRYLTWDSAAPAVHAQGLAAFVGGAIDPDAGMGPPTRGSQRVTSTEIVEAQTVGAGEHLYTVAADTGGASLTYLSVDVVRDGSGELRLGRYPALIGPPLAGPAVGLDGVGSGDVTDPAVTTVVGRVLRNYLVASAQNLAADLAPGSVVTTPEQHLSLDRVDQLRVGAGNEVLATVGVADSLGATYTLTYQVGLSRAGGRWLVDAIQSDPRT